MTARTTIIAAGIVAIALLVAAGAGFAMIDGAHTPDNVDPVAELDDEDPPDDEPPNDEPPNDENDENDVGEPMLEIDVDRPDDGVPTGESAEITITALDGAGDPVEGVQIALDSLGIAGETELSPLEGETDEAGEFVAEWHYNQPEETEGFSMKPPAESVTIFVEATIEDTDISETITIYVDMDYFADGCHEPGDPDIQ